MLDFLQQLRDQREYWEGIFPEIRGPNGETDKLRSRLINTLVNDGITTTDQLRVMSDAELMRIPNFGRESLKRVKGLFDPRGTLWPHEVKTLEALDKIIADRFGGEHFFENDKMPCLHCAAGDYAEWLRNCFHAHARAHS